MDSGEDGHCERRRSCSAHVGLRFGQFLAAFGLDDLAGLGELVNVVLALPAGPVACAISPAVFGPSLSASRTFARV